MYTQLSGSSGNILGFKIIDYTTPDDVREISRIMSEAIAEWRKIRLLVEIEGFRHMEREDLLEKLRFAVDHEPEIERMAVLSNRTWIKAWVKVGGLLSNTEMEHFDRNEMEAAWEWIRS